MVAVRRLVLLSVAVLALAACGSGHKTTTSTGPSAQTQIRAAYVTFFSSSTPIDDRVALLQNGQKFKSVVKSFANNPLAKNVSAKVFSVTLQGPRAAKVIYSVSIGGTSLGKQTGSAVLENGGWKVGTASLCKLIEQGGSTPSACKS